jgi:hypothetical protein
LADKKQLGQEERKQLRTIKQALIRDHMKVQMWSNLFDKYSTLQGNAVYTQELIVHLYQKSSLIYHLFYGKQPVEIIPNDNIRETEHAMNEEIQ